MLPLVYFDCALCLVSAYISNWFRSLSQTIVVLAEGGCSPVRHPEDGTLRPFHCVMDKWQL